MTTPDEMVVYNADTDAWEFVWQRSRWNPLLEIVARLTRRNYYWYLDRASGKRRLWFGDIRKPGGSR